MNRQKHKERVAALFEQYQNWFIQERKNWGMYEITGNPGWFEIVADLLAGIKATLPPALQERFLLAQIKEKFGTLRVYYEGQPMFVDCLGSGGPSSFQVQSDENPFVGIDELINEAVERSAKTCMYCGDAGSIRTQGWWLTLCDKHHKLNQEGKNLKSDFETMTTPSRSS